jgi:DNA-binding CsgD family transcriptional regulator
MDYIPKANNPVINPIKEEIGSWTPFTTDMLKRVINGNVSDQQIEKMFPGTTFFGTLCKESSSHQISQAIDVLKATLCIHSFLQQDNSILRYSPEDFTDENVFNSLEETAQKLIHSLLNELKNYSIFELKTGVYDEANVQNLYTLTIPLSDSYTQWLRPRVKSYSNIGEVTNIIPYAFLNMGYETSFHKRKSGTVFQMKIFGRESLLESWDELFILMAKKNDNEHYYIEKYIGLMALADFLSSIHLMTTNVQIRDGQMFRPTSGDLLTDFWFNCYDDSSDNDVIVKNCEVCNGLFITSSKTQKGHERCMNKKRVAESRAKKYLKLRAGGKTAEEAASLASISPNTAEKILMRKYGNKISEQ